MSLVERVVQRARRDYFRWQYQKVARQVLDTRPVRQGDLPFTLLSMVHQRDVHSYLVAVKSFTHFLNPSRIVVVCDPSIDETDRARIDGARQRLVAVALHQRRRALEHCVLQVE